MKFRNITIPAEGRNKYGNYASTTELTKSVVRVTYNGNNTTGGNTPKPPSEISRDVYTLLLSRSNIKFEHEKLVEGNVTETIEIIGYKNSMRADTFIGSLNTMPENDVLFNNIYYDIEGKANTGMMLLVANNGTPNTKLQIVCTSAATQNEIKGGTLIIPCSVYKKSGEIPLGPYLSDWVSAKEDCYTLLLELQWEITAPPTIIESEGRRGAAIRGPYDWSSQTVSRRWCNGEFVSDDYPEDEEFIDIVVYNDVYYKCIKSYTGAGRDAVPPLAYWEQVDERYDFVASNLLLADNAKIKFATNNELYLTDDDGVVTAGAAGGTGVSFWAGSSGPSEAPFKVNYDGTMEATKGRFGVLEIGYDAIGNESIKGQSTFGDESWDLEFQPHRLDMRGPNGRVQIAPDPYQDAVDTMGYIEVETNDPRNTALYTDGTVEANQFKKQSYSSKELYAPFCPLRDLEITFISDTNNFVLSNGEWLWRGQKTGMDTVGGYYNFVKEINGEWTYVISTSATSGIGSGIYTSAHIKQSNRIYLVI